MTKGGTTYGRADEVVTRQSDGVVLVLPIDRAEVSVLEGVTALVWAALDDPASADDLAEQLRDQAPIDVDVTRDVVVALGQLTEAGLLVEHKVAVR